MSELTAFQARVLCIRMCVHDTLPEPKTNKHRANTHRANTLQQHLMMAGNLKDPFMSRSLTVSRRISSDRYANSARFFTYKSAFTACERVISVFDVIDNTRAR
jgi:hypothetical protein